MKVGIKTTVQPGDIKNLLNVCDPRKSRTHGVYGQVQVSLSTGHMTWMCCRNMRHLVVMTFPIELELPNPIDLSIHEGTEFLKAIGKGGEIAISMTPDAVILTPPEGSPLPFLASYTQAKLSFRQMEAEILVKSPTIQHGWSQVGFYSTDARLFAGFQNSAGKPANITLHCAGGKATPFTIKDSQVHGYTSLNKLTTEWNPE